jgi:hypothetical protein
VLALLGGYKAPLQIAFNIAANLDWHLGAEVTFSRTV